MNRYTFFISLMLVTVCKTSNAVGFLEKATGISEIKNHEEYCPEDGDCSLKIYKNSSIVLKKDTTDMYYPVIEKGNNIVVEYTFFIKGPEGTSDGDYSETIHFEIKETTKSLHIEDDTLVQVNLLFGKHCFCRGEAGYYKVNDGNLILKKSHDKLIIDLSFSLDEVSQKVTRIKEVIAL